MSALLRALVRRHLRFTLLSGLAILLSAGFAKAQSAEVELTVQVDQPMHRISPRLYGIFFEDINFGGDGGLSAELVKNGGFEFPQPLMGWNRTGDESAGEIKILNESPRLAANPNFLRIEADDDDRAVGALNEGYRGMGVRQGEQYRFSAWMRATAGQTEALRVQLVAPDGQVLAEAPIEVRGSQWQQIEATLAPSATQPRAALALQTDSKGIVDVDMASLCPRNTWKGRPHGLRADLVQMLADLKPAFFRFPGGCIVEGSELKHRYQWKTTIGDLDQRRLIVNRWNTEFRHRPTPDYFQSFTLGFFEYFQLCEDIGAEPLPILNCGMACQFNSGELAPLEELEPYVQDALDLIEFANGPATSAWGARRAAMGHPEPFGMKLLGIGNEQWGPQYIDRFRVFAERIEQRHPEIELVSSAGPSPGDDRFRYLWPELRALNADIVDEHCYAMPDWFRASAMRYDGYPRQGPRVFMGEYAAQSVGIASPDNRNTLGCALAEAAFLTGIERNSDVVTMSSYAPLLGHEDAWQWRPNLIWFDNLRCYATPNYYVQQLFGLHRGDAALRVTLADGRAAENPAGRVGVATYETSAEFTDVTVMREGQSLFDGDFAAPASMTSSGGRWTRDGGLLRQEDRRATGRAAFGDTDWTDYTLRLKARKLGGREGFIIMFRNGYGGSYVQWNLGGWGNQQHGLQRNDAGVESIIEQKPGSIEEDRWYDVRIELAGQRVRCFLDDELVHDVDAPAPALPRLYATASRDDDGTVIIKVVNTTGQAAVAAVRLEGLREAPRSGEAIVLAGDPWDENSLEAPEELKPTVVNIDSLGSEFDHEFPPHSLTVLCVK